MPTTDGKGNTIPDDDPRLPSPQSTQALRDQAESAKAWIEQHATLGPLVELEARVMALEATLINPDVNSAPRRLFDYRLEKARIEVFGRIALAIRAAHDRQGEAEKAKIEVASTADVIRVAHGA